MAKIITSGLQKGGVGKTTTAGTLCYLLAEDGYKVLGVAMDSQSNLSNLLTKYDYTYFEGSTVLEAIEAGDIEPYIYKVTENLHVLPSNDNLETIANFFYIQWKGRNQSLALHELLGPLVLC
ncbi:AAA family ATPase [Bacillus infantis]|uniref:ParA family protein n=1 Tax=Bacillus infantis TaxID=324767 RepID=UPI001CD4A51A|nr:AAA family ATPase [Bacillus infantis]MCA1037458.1 AAA family ATPase [Bacillus infantis]HER2025508.1 AAA family ATPase [Streptococcus pyogenes]